MTDHPIPADIRGELLRRIREDGTVPTELMGPLVCRWLDEGHSKEEIVAGNIPVPMSFFRNLLVGMSLEDITLPYDLRNEVVRRMLAHYTPFDIAVVIKGVGPRTVEKIASTNWPRSGGAVIKLKGHDEVAQAVVAVTILEKVDEYMLDDELDE